MSGSFERSTPLGFLFAVSGVSRRATQQTLNSLRLDYDATTSTSDLKWCAQRAATEVSVLSLSKYWLLTVTLFSASLSFATGCATGGAQTHHGIAAGQWQARLPNTRSPIAELAFGRGGSGTPAQLSSEELAALASPTPDDVLQPMAAAKTVAVNKPESRRVLPAAPKAAAMTASAAPEPAPAPSVSESPAPLLASNDVKVAQRYAQREQSASDQQKFRGGDAIIISGGVLLVVLLIVLLVLLLR